MTRTRCGLTSLVTLVMLQSCSISYLELRNELDSANNSNADYCEVSFSLSYNSADYTNTYGVVERREKYLSDVEKYRVSKTLEFLRNMGCDSVYVDKNKGATLNIAILEQRQFSALPQEWLTGLSLGLIPSWGTREAQYIYDFKNTVTGKSKTYYVDEKSFAHILLLPVFWITFFTLDEGEKYEDALKDFIGNS